MDAVSGLLGKSKTKALENRIAELTGEIQQKQEEINKLTIQFKSKEQSQDKEINQLKERLKKIDDYFPRISKLISYVDYCQNLGLNEEQARQIINGQTVIYDGSLYSRHKSITCHVKGTHLKLLIDKQNNFHLSINGTAIHQWFKQQKEEFLLKKRTWSKETE